MKVRILLGCILIICCSAVPGRASDDVISNEAFVKNAFEDITDTLFSDFPSGGRINLILECGSCPSQFFTNILCMALKQKASDLYIDNKENKVDRLEINLYNSSFYYNSSGGSLFKSGRLERIYAVGIQALYLDPSGRIIWQNEIEREYSEKIDRELAEKHENRHDSGLFHALIPATKRGRLWEPIVISGLLGGLIYLFFASR
jgi:hypothetical protein